MQTLFSWILSISILSIIITILFDFNLSDTTLYKTYKESEIILIIENDRFNKDALLRADNKYINLLLDMKEDLPLTLATKKENIKAIKILLEKGANPNLSNRKGESPLIIAVRTTNIDIVKTLLEKGANPNYANYKDYARFTPLTTLINRYSNSDEEDTKEKRLEILDILLNAGAKADGERVASSDELEYLSEKNERLEVKDPFWEAIKYEHFEIASKLMEFGVDVKSKSIEDNRTYLKKLFYEFLYTDSLSVETTVRIVQFLTDNGLKLNEKDDEGDTSIHYLFGVYCDKNRNNIVRVETRPKRGYLCFGVGNNFQRTMDLFTQLSGFLKGDDAHIRDQFGKLFPIYLKDGIKQRHLSQQAEARLNLYKELGIIGH